jgi:predicted RNase H-like HicB family nuclease
MQEDIRLLAFGDGRWYIDARRRGAMTIEVDVEEDGRWIAEVPDLPGVMAYGRTRKEAVGKVEALALRVVADRLEHGEG